MIKFENIFFILIMFAGSAQARLFDFSKERVAAYLSYMTGPSLVKKAGYLNEASTAYSYSDELANNTSGEFGFIYSTPRVSFRFGFEFIKPLKLTQITAKDASLTTMYSLNSDVSGYIPKIGLELSLFYRPQSRGFLYMYGGSASVTVTNDYTMAAAGTAAFPSVVDHQVLMGGTSMAYGGALAYEMWMNDTTTLLFELGYQSLKFEKLTYSKAVTTFSGTKASGDVVNDISGIARTLDMTYFFGTLGIRIYL